jgi:transcriptional regulator with XRE-family HTH domain
MAKKPKLISESIRELIETCGQSRYRISQETGISQSNLSRFMSGQTNLSMNAIDRLCQYLEVQLTLPGRRSGRSKS